MVREQLVTDALASCAKRGFTAPVCGDGFRRVLNGKRRAVRGEALAMPFILLQLSDSGRLAL